MAVRERFELSLGVNLNTLSRRAPSATQPSHQIRYIKHSNIYILSALAHYCVRVTPGFLPITKFIAYRNRYASAAYGREFNTLNQDLLFTT